MTIVSGSPEETAAAGERLARTLRPGDVVGLRGELGAGKTCFVQGVARGLGVRGRVSSPTFTLINEHAGTWPVHHVDAYRLEGPAEAAGLGLEELLDGDGVTLVEWSERLGPHLPPRTIDVHLAGVGDEPRLVTVTRPDPR